MSMRLLWSLLAVLAVAGCKSGAGNSLAVATGADAPEKFLKWSMDQHKALRSFHAQYQMKYDMGGSAAGMGALQPTMTVDYQAPNKFRIETGTMGMVQAVISDGTKQVTTTGLAGYPGQTSVSPGSIAAAGGGTTMAMFGNATPMFTMFAGAGAYDVLVDASKGKATFGATKDVDGEPCREVKFFATGMAGNTTVLISEKTGMARRWECDMAPLASMFRGSTSETTNGKTTTTTSESKPKKTSSFPGKISLAFDASGLKENVSIDVAKFDTTKLPTSTMPDLSSTFKSTTNTGANSKPAEEATLKEGSVAPDFTVTTLDGQTVSLASLKGKPVMLDFWATWCGPCRETLPETDKISQKYKNLTVLAVSDEDKPTVEKFVNDNHYKFRACLDKSGDMNRAYKISGIPCFVFIDANGKVAKYIVGSGQSSDVDAALKQIGAS